MKAQTRLLLAGLCALTAAGVLLAGCGKSNQEDDSNTITITTGNSTSATELVAEVLEKQFPDIHFEVERYAGANTTTYLSEKLSHEDGPDIFVYTTNLSDEMAEKYLLDLSGYSFVGNYDSGILENLDVNGGIYQLSGPINIRGLLVNKSLFEEHGWKIPDSFADLVDVCKQIREDTPDMTPIALGTKGAAVTFGLVGGYAQCGFLNTPDGLAWEKSYMEGNASIAEGFGEGLDMMEELINAGAFESDPYEELWGPGYEAVGNRKCAMAYVLANMQDYIPYLDGSAGKDKEMFGQNADDEFVLLPYFGAEEGEEGINVYMSVAFGLNKHLGEKENSKKLENALKAIEYLSTAEGQEKLKTNDGQIAVVGGNGSAPEYYQRLWDLGEYGAKRFYLYSGYEDVIVECGELVKNAIREKRADGMKEAFISTADRLHKENLEGESAASAYGTVSEDLNLEQTAQVMRNAVQAQGLSDITLATHSDEVNGVMNRQGSPTGFAGKWYAGPVNDVILTIALGELGERIELTKLTGAEIKTLLNEGSVRSTSDGKKSATFIYGWSGMDVTFDKDGKVESMTCDGKEMKDDELYTVAFPDGDYSADFAESHEIENTEIRISDAAKEYLRENSPISAPEVPRATVVE